MCRIFQNVPLSMSETLVLFNKPGVARAVPKMTHCSEALKPMLSNYFCTIQILRGPYLEIWRTQIQIYTQNSIQPKYGAFYLKYKVSVLLQSLLVQLR